jgi:hypothetical protein
MAKQTAVPLHFLLQTVSSASFWSFLAVGLWMLCILVLACYNLSAVGKQWNKSI